MRPDAAIDPGAQPAVDPASSAGLYPDCYETGTEADDDATVDESFSVEAARQAPHGLLGMPEHQLPS